MKICLIVLAIVAASLALFAIDQRRQISDLRSTIASSQTQLVDHTKQAAFEMQEKCAAQAALVFRNLGYNEAKQLADYESHFSEAKNKCFLKFRVTNMSDGLSVTIYLMDAFERRTYGSYFWASRGSLSYREVRPITCELSFPGSQKVFCKSEEEFEAATHSYLE